MHVAADLDVDVVAVETDDQVTVMLAFDAQRRHRSPGSSLGSSTP